MIVPAFLAPAAIKGVLKKAWPLLIVAAVALVLLLTYCEGRKSGTAAADLARERGNVISLEAKNKADNHAAERRRLDDARLSTEEAALKGVRDNAKSPTDRRAARHRCLRDQQAARAAGRPAPAC